MSLLLVAGRKISQLAEGQQNVEMYQDAVNKKFGTNHNIPVVFYSQLMAVAFGMDAKEDAALNQNVIRAKKLEKMAKK